MGPMTPLGVSLSLLMIRHSRHLAETECLTNTLIQTFEGCLPIVPVAYPNKYLRNLVLFFTCSRHGFLESSHTLKAGCWWNEWVLAGFQLRPLESTNLPQTLLGPSRRPPLVWIVMEAYPTDFSECTWLKRVPSLGQSQHTAGIFNCLEVLTNNNINLRSFKT